MVSETIKFQERMVDKTFQPVPLGLTIQWYPVLHEVQEKPDDLDASNEGAIRKE